MSRCFSEPNAPYSIFFSLRTGGVSKGVYRSMNLGVSTEDDDISIEKNFALFQKKTNYPTPLITASQVHGTSILSLEKEVSETGESLHVSNGKEKALKCEIERHSTHTPLPLEADGLYTEEKALPIGIYTADCLPIVATDNEGSYALALHAGWRGLTDGIIEEGFRLLSAKGKKPEKVYLLPAIGACCFEMGGAYLNRFRKEALVQKKNRWYVDLQQEALLRLLDAELSRNQVSVNTECTSCKPSCFFSYRRDGKTGRHLSIIWLKKKP